MKNKLKRIDQLLQTIHTIKSDGRKVK